MALTPFEILNTDMALVFDIYVNCIIHDSKKKNNQNDQEEWVTSKTATWH
jgi:hypothetical protein